MAAIFQRVLCTLWLASLVLGMFAARWPPLRSVFTADVLFGTHLLLLLPLWLFQSVLYSPHGHVGALRDDRLETARLVLLGSAIAASCASADWAHAV